MLVRKTPRSTFKLGLFSYILHHRSLLLLLSRSHLVWHSGLGEALLQLAYIATLGHSGLKQ